MFSALKNIFTLLLPRSSKPVEKEAKEIYQQKFVNINLKPYMKPTIRGEQVTKVRVNMGLTQKQFGELLGVKQAAVSGWETSRVMPLEANFKKLRELTGKRIGYFLRK